MNSKFASLLTIAALTAAASTSSFASDSAYPAQAASQSSSAVSSGKTRAEVQAELRDAKRMGYNVNASDSAFLGLQAAAPTTGTVSRAQVRNEALQARRFDANENLYRN